MQPLVLLSSNLSLFIEINRHCNEQGWYISNMTDPRQTIELVNNGEVSGLIWDLSAAPLKKHKKELQILRENIEGPIIVIAPKENHDERLTCYGLNIDTYLIEPVDYVELIARLKQLFWVYNKTQKNNLIDFEDSKKIKDRACVKCENLQIDFKQYIVTNNGVDLGLTPKEFSLLWYLMKHRGQVLSRDQLLEGVWGYDSIGSSRIIDIHISHLRDKLEKDPQNPQWIKTIRGFGYILDLSYPLVAEGN
ncbi:winged helix-turn-helix transcriptional regulator [Companilactobacillus mishanensis]|uniref:Response regulator transcription factor n=1 Tax=Companilactobacillus mishanensis TaxID=2486008 RepID=A0A5P0ZIY2_9LACO|nr:response regulator transcription factor [Companilactobacillus mishanensis]MQS53076.1 response regulator transcription factor [Companilactobacillus mishanensis]MQS89764.1 response regulator transcription factor [Companilactobacillus mishanensis]